MDCSSVLRGGGIIPFSKEPYMTLSRHTAPSRKQVIEFDGLATLRPASITARGSKDEIAPLINNKSWGIEGVYPGQGK